MRVSAAALIATLVLVAAALLGVASRTPPAPAPLDAPATQFSAARAQAALAPIAGEPRVPGTPAHAAARDHLRAQLLELGLESTVLEGLGYLHLPGQSPTVTAAGRVETILATRRAADPSASTGTVVLATHYDSVVGSPGAADPGIGLATLLEATRALADDPAAPNDLAVLITDGEEAGLLGAQAFVRDHAHLLKAPVVVINHEARGGAGRPVTIRASGDLAAHLARTPRPEVESAMEAMFELVPNNTDFSIFTEAGWRGVDTATAGDSWAYHTPADNLARLDLGALQQMGDTTLALSRDLLRTDLADIDREPDGPTTTLAWGLVTFPSWSVAPLAALGLLLASAAVAWRRMRAELSILAALGGAGLALIVVAAAAIGATATWEVATALDPARASLVVGEPARPLPYLAAQLVAAAAVFTIVTRWARRRPGLEAIAVGGVWLFAALTLFGALAMPSAVTWLLVPVVAASAGLVASVPLVGMARVALVTLSLLPAAWMTGAQISGAFDSGVGLGAPLIGAFAGLALVFAASVSEAVRHTPEVSAVGAVADENASARPGRRSRGRAVAVEAGLVAVALAVPAAATGVAAALDSPAHAPRQELAGARIETSDAGETTAFWHTSVRTPWGTAANGRTAPADPALFAAPTITVTADRLVGDRREVSLQLTSRRQAPRMELEVEGGRLAEVTVDAVEAPDPRGSSLILTGMPPGPVEVTLTLADLQDKVALHLHDDTADLAAVPGYTAPPSDVLLVLPQVTVATRHHLPGRPQQALPSP